MGWVRIEVTQFMPATVRTVFKISTVIAESRACSSLQKRFDTAQKSS